LCAGSASRWRCPDWIATTSLTGGRIQEIWEGSGAIHLSGFTAPQVRVALGFSF
jgi:hypothetical protein